MRSRVPIAAGILILAAWASEAPSFLPVSFDARRFLDGGREAPSLSRLPLDDPRARPLRLEPAFPALRFDEPVSAMPAPGGGDELYVLEHGGALWEVQPAHGGSRRLVLDLTDRVFHRNEAGAEGFVFHPDFARPGTQGHGALFVFYVTERDGRLHDRLARFSWSEGRFEPGSEIVLIEQRHDWQEENDWGEHFAGSLLFGADDMLYVAVGDEGGHQESVNPQRIDRDLFSGILRIDPDCRPGRSHSPLRQPETGRTAHYCIPNDNPFVGVPGALEEFWALGLRNPWGPSFDAETGTLWIADVGKFDVEEINHGVAGGNYQWAYREGDRASWSAGGAAGQRLGTERAPLFTYRHGAGENSIVGGVVYRGSLHDELAGQYVFGDHGSGRIRSLLSTPEAPVPVVEELAALAPTRLLGFAQDRQRELLLLARRPHGILRLARGDGQKRAQAPLRLSETGLFADLASLTPARGVLPYAVNAPSFNDGAASRRWIAIPGDGSDGSKPPILEHIVFRKDTSWIFPPGTVLIQHLELPAQGRDAERVRVETRVLVLPRGGSVYGLGYRWDADGRDAIRIDATSEGVVGEAAEQGARGRPWVFLGSEACASCHNAASGYVLGAHARQLTGEADLEGMPEAFEQLPAWSRAGLLTTAAWAVAPVPDEDLRVEPLRRIADESASLEARARSYLDVNCSACHRGTGASLSLTSATPTAALLDQPVRNAFGIERVRLVVPGSPERSLLLARIASDDPGLRMPPIGRHVVDREAVDLIGEWIRSLAPAPFLPLPRSR